MKVFVVNRITKKKLSGLFSWMGFNCLIASRATSLVLSRKFLEISGTHFIDLRKMKR